jgi:hypothetical protein
MAVAIGFRVAPDAIHWAVVSLVDGLPVLEDHAQATLPKDYNEQEALSWVRDRVLHLLDQHRVEIAGMKYPEQIARSKHADAARTRSRIEGVILQALHERGVRAWTGAFKALSGTIGSGSAKAYLETEDLRGMRWEKLPTYRREAALFAYAALESKWK